MHEDYSLSGPVELLSSDGEIVYTLHNGAWYSSRVDWSWLTVNEPPPF